MSEQKYVVKRTADSFNAPYVAVIREDRRPSYYTDKLETAAKFDRATAFEVAYNAARQERVVRVLKLLTRPGAVTRKRVPVQDAKKFALANGAGTRFLSPHLLPTIHLEEAQLYDSLEGAMGAVEMRAIRHGHGVTSGGLGRGDWFVWGIEEAQGEILYAAVSID